MMSSQQRDPSKEEETDGEESAAASSIMAGGTNSKMSEQNLYAAGEPQEQPVTKDRSTYCSARKWTVAGITVVVVVCSIIVIFIHMTTDEDEGNTGPTSSPTLRGER